MLDRVTHRKAMKDELTTIVRMLMRQPMAVKGELPKPAAPDASKEASKSATP